MKGFLIIGSLAQLLNADTAAEAVTAAADLINFRLVIVVFLPKRFCMILCLPFKSAQTHLLFDRQARAVQKYIAALNHECMLTFNP